MPTLSHVRENVVVCLHVEDDQCQTVLLGAAIGEESVNGARDQVPRDPPINPAQHWEDRSVVGGSVRGPVLPGLLPNDGGGDCMPSPGLWGRVAMEITNLRIHFIHCHVRDMLVILERGTGPTPNDPPVNPPPSPSLMGSPQYVPPKHFSMHTGDI